MVISFMLHAYYSDYVVRYTLLVITTRMSLVGFLTPVPGTLPGSFHAPSAGPTSHIAMIATANVTISFSANILPLQIAEPDPHGFSRPYRAVSFPDDGSSSRNRPGSNLSGSL